MKPLPPSPDELPSSYAIADSPQLASLALLHSALRVAPIALDVQHPHLGCINTPPHDDAWPAALLAGLIVDRCRELSELIAVYRALLDPPLDPTGLDGDTPF
jgi:hypothetical protein